MDCFQPPPIKMAYTTLFISVQENNYQAVLNDLDFCLNNGIDINQQESNLDGNTPLHHAVINNNQDIVELLLSKGADKFATNKHGEIPIELAKTETIKAMLK